MRKSLAVMAVLLGLQTAAPAQSADGLIVGRVIDADSGRGVPEAIVTLGGGGGAPTSPLTPVPPGRRVLSDPNGYFVFRQLAQGRYNIGATKPGYGMGLYGRLVPRGPGSQLPVRQGEKLTGVQVLMWKQASITGRVIDEAGEPVVAADVRVQREHLVAGRPGLANIAGTTTDDRGMYRIPALDPGRYVISVPSTSTSLPAAMVEAFSRATGEARAEMQQALFAAAPTMTSAASGSNQQIGEHLLQIQNRLPMPPPPSQSSTSLAIYPRVYFPNASRVAEASRVTLRSGEMRTGVDMQLRAIASVRVTGRVESAEGTAGISSLFLMHAGPDGEPLGSVADAVATTVSDVSGAFTFLGVPPGPYSLVAMKLPWVNERTTQATVVQTPGGAVARGLTGELASASTRPALWATQRLVADRDVSNVRVMLTPGYKLSGRLVYDDKAAQPTREPQIWLEAADEWVRTLGTGEDQRQAAPDGTFAIPAMPAGRYQLTVPLPEGRFVKSVLINGRDTGDLPFVLDRDVADAVVTISSRGARVNGIVRTEKGQPDATAGVIVFAADSRAWVDLSAYPRRLKEVRASSDGSYIVADLPPGDYLIAAAPQAAFDWSLSDFFERFSRVATRITLGEGEGRTLDLRVSQVK